MILLYVLGVSSVFSLCLLRVWLVVFVWYLLGIMCVCVARTVSGLLRSALDGHGALHVGDVLPNGGCGIYHLGKKSKRVCVCVFVVLASLSDS